MLKQKAGIAKLYVYYFHQATGQNCACHRLEHGGRYALDSVAGFSIYIHSLLNYVDCMTDILKVMVPNSFPVDAEGWLCKPVQSGLIPLSNCESNTAVAKSFVGTNPQNEF